MRHVFLLFALLCALGSAGENPVLPECVVSALLPDDAEGTCALLGDTEIMRRLREEIALVAPHRDVSVLIIGRTGTGKKIVARRIHRLSPRKDHKFFPLNCAAFSEQLLESQLFGHKKGAFTGASMDNPGWLLSAGEGTVFLDEVGEMPLSIQAKLLRAIQEKEVLPVGSNVYVPIFSRVIAATNRDLDEEVREGRFRDDLYFRLNQWEIETPELAAHAADIAIITTFLLARLSVRLGLAPRTLDAEALAMLTRYAWPGNVRQLENVLQRALIYSGNSTTISIAHLPARLMPPAVLRLRPENSDTPNYNLTDNERRLIKAALDATGWNRLQAAKLLGIDRRALSRRISVLGLTPPPNLLATGTDGDD